MTTRLFGAPVQRVEDQRFLRGGGRYTDDVAVSPSTLHAAVLRSPHAHARILDIDVEQVLDLDGVHAVWTYDDLVGPMAEPLPLLIPHPDLTEGRTQYALAKDEVNHVGGQPTGQRGHLARDPRLGLQVAHQRPDAGQAVP